jgi:hypothetical protein
MKVTNWRKKLIAGLVAAGVLAPGVGHAVDIPLGDPSFEAYVVPVPPNYAYAGNPNGAYRPTSAWIDDLDNPPGFTQDNGNSNWIYNATYAEPTTGTNRRPAPRTGNQAMHGLDGNFNAQETAALFEVEKTYTFSVWAQNDVLLDQSNGVGLYIFDGNVPFSAANSLSSRLFTTTVPQRITGMTPAQSQANWGKITVRHTVFPGDSSIGHPVGVAFSALRDSAVDDAALQVDNATDFLLTLEVNTTNGQVRMRNQTGAAVRIDYYEIKSTAGALNATAWNSLQEQNLPGFPAGNGSGNGWEQAGGSTANVIGESYLVADSSVGTSTPVGLGAAYNIGGTHDLIFQYGAIAAGANPSGDYDNNGVVDAADFVIWRNNVNQNVTLPNDTTSGTVTQADYTVWRSNFGQTAPAVPSTLTRGLVRYVSAFSGLGAGTAVPEPACVILVGIGVSAIATAARRRSA